jgi:hypothetical protein
MYGLNIGSNFPGTTGDLTSGALASIPSALQSQLGGTMLVGAHPAGMAQVSRTSDGPALTAFNPANFASANTFPSSVNASVLVSYPENHQTLGAWGSVVNQYTSEADTFSAIALPPNSQSVLVVGTHGVGGPGLACSGMATSGVNCYGEFTATCSEVCMANPPAGSGIPTCGSGNTTCGGSSRGSWDCCYDPRALAIDAGGHGDTAWPYQSYVWAYDVGNSDGSNSSGNNVASMPSTASGYAGNTGRNNLTAVKLGYVNPWDLYPYATWQLNDPFNAAANQAQSGPVTGGTYDPVSGKLYVSLLQGQPSTELPIIEVYQITPPAGTQQFTVTASAGSNGGISPSGSVQVNSGSTQQFTVTPNSGYTASVGGTCGGSLVGNTFTTNSITANCTVTAAFNQTTPPPSSSISRLQGAYNSSSALIPSLAYPNNVSANSLLLVTVTWGSSSSNTTPTVSDSLGNSFSLVQVKYDAPMTQGYVLYYAVNTKGAGADTVKVSYASGSNYGGLIIEEFSGIAASSPLDGSAVQDQQNITGGTNALSSGSFSTSSAGDLIYVSTFNPNQNISSLAPGANFTSSINVSSFWSNTGPFAGTEYTIQSSSGSIAGTFTTSNTSGVYATTIAAAFKASSSPVPSPPTGLRLAN